jgi:hypothetical protein
MGPGTQRAYHVQWHENKETWGSCEEQGVVWFGLTGFHYDGLVVYGVPMEYVLWAVAMWAIHIPCLTWKVEGFSVHLNWLQCWKSSPLYKSKNP